jgi:pyruvate/2-oxoglutarate dehydrogenase complex dihydrolipoamide acyltransferase (E2) component
MPALDHLSRAAGISLTVARRAGTLALSTARQVADMAVERRSRSRARTSWTPPPPVSSAPPSTQPREAPPAAPAPEPASTSDPAPAPVAAPAADRVDREAVVVAESADDGVCGGAGAQIRIGEPWEGYGSLTVKQINDRLADANPETLAVARLYETANRNRVTVLKEIDRRLAAAER